MRILITHRTSLFFILAIYAGMEIYCLQKLSVNYDEGQFATYGASILKLKGNKDVATYDSKLPITAVNMLPRAIEQLIHPGLSKTDSEEDIMRGRFVSLAIMLLLAILIFNWTHKLYGETAALFSLILFLICPNFLAHGIFLSSDIFACFFCTLSFYFLWKFNLSRKLSTFIYLSCAVALAEISKFSMVHLYFIILFLLLINHWKGKNENSRALSWKRFAGYLLIFIGINWLVISAAHLFYEMFLPLSSYNFQSSTFQNIQSFFGSLSSHIPVPLPSSYVKSLDVVMYFDHLGGGRPGSLNGAPYILGQNSPEGFWYYYLVTIFFKVPIPALILISLSIFFYFKNIKSALFVRNEMYLLIPAAYYLLYMSFFYSTQIGIRHLLIIFPLLFVFTGYAFSLFTSKRAVVFRNLLLLWQMISVGLYFPHFLPYTNEFILNKKYAYRKIADTNLCYGEGYTYLQKWMDKNPSAKYLPRQIESGTIVMEVNEMLDLDIQTQGKFNWARELDPKDHIQSQYLIFEISDSLANQLRSKYNE